MPISAKPQTARGCGRFCVCFDLGGGDRFCPVRLRFALSFSKNIVNRYELAHAEPLYSCGFAPASERVV